MAENDPEKPENRMNPESEMNKETPPEKEASKDPRPASVDDKSNEKPKGDLFFIVREIWGMVKILFGIVWELMKMVIRLEETTDVEGTIESVSKGIELKGYNIWILIASAILASIGLDTNSVAVIIGAMLISPLMSPILGIGLSVGINDRQMLSRSLYNFGLAIGISLGTAVLYFLVSPLGVETPEITARTTPTLLDIGIAFFGGVAGIVAGSRKDKTNAIPGVAIATALMPPICVAGYGLASWNFTYFSGAFYLFFLNSVFISLSTFLIIRFLNFPLAERVSSGLRKNFLRGVVFFVVVTMVPATMIFIQVIKDLQRDSAIEQFLYDTFDSKKDFAVQTRKYIEEDSVNYLRVAIQCDKYLSRDSVQVFERRLNDEYGLKNTVLIVTQNEDDPNNAMRQRQEMEAYVDAKFENAREEQLKREQLSAENTSLREEIERLRGDTIPVRQMREEIREWVEGIDRMDMGVLTASDFANKTEAERLVFTVLIHWVDSVSTEQRAIKMDKIRSRIRSEIPIDSVLVQSLP